jgi:hypothetical protein
LVVGTKLGTVPNAIFISRTRVLTATLIAPVLGIPSGLPTIRVLSNSQLPGTANLTIVKDH